MWRCDALGVDLKRGLQNRQRLEVIAQTERRRPRHGDHIGLNHLLLGIHGYKRLIISSINVHGLGVGTLTRGNVEPVHLVKHVVEGARDGRHDESLDVAHLAARGERSSLGRTRA